MYFTASQNTDMSKLAMIVLLCLLSILTFYRPALAANMQSLDSIRGELEVHLASRYPAHTYKTQLGKIDSRLQLTPCNDLNVFKPAHTRELGQTTLGVKCNSGASWLIFVPVTIQKFSRVAVAKQDYSRGHVMRAGDIKMVSRDVSDLHQGYFEQSGSVKDMVARRTIRRGTVITPGMVKHPRFVKRGDEIVIVAESKNLVIRAKGKAMMDGRKGDRIRVKNTQSKREFQATVIAPGTVQVTM